MSANLIGNRYARGLYEGLNKDNVEAKQVADYLKQLVGLFSQDKFKKVLVSPVVQNDIKLEILTSGLDDSSDKLLTQFMKTLVEAGRVSALPYIYESFVGIIKASEGCVEAELITAVEISQKYQDEIKADLEKKFGQKISLTPKVDAAILGGFIAKFANSEYDMSLKKKLNVFAQEAIA